MYLSGIPSISIEKTNTEVPYSFIGKIGNWTFKRAWNYWVAETDSTKNGLILSKALELHYKKNPIDKTQIMGTSIRSGGHCGCPSPDEYGADPCYDDNFYLKCKELSIEMRIVDGKEYPILNCGQVSELCNEGKLTIERYVNCYHIDNQIGLNEFAHTITECMLIEAGKLLNKE